MQVRVGPGLDQGYTSLPSGGFHNRLRIMPKSTDQLFVNPKTSYEGRTIRGSSIVPLRTSQN